MRYFGANSLLTLFSGLVHLLLGKIVWDLGRLVGGRDIQLDVGGE